MFAAGTNLPVGPYLCYYGLFPDPAMAQTKLHGFEKYIAFAGFLFFLVTIYTVWSILKNTYTKPETSANNKEGEK